MEYHPVRISDVIRGVNRDYYLPAIQREFVWEPDRIEKLFDSIMGDFPIGSFLFWKVEEEHKNDWAVYEFIRKFDRDNPHNDLADLRGVTKDIYLVLDGQQRITSLYIGLKGSYRYFYYRWRETKLYLNLLKEPIPNDENPEKPTYQFSFRENGNAKDPQTELWYQVGRILDFEDAEDAKTDLEPEIADLPEEAKTNAKKIIGRLHARVHTVLVINYYEEKSQDYDKVLTIFVRANSAGKPLEYSDLLLSTATAKWGTLDARKEIHEFTDEINRTGPGYSFGKDFILKGCLYMTDSLPIQYKVKNFTRQNLLKVEEHWERTKNYMSTAVRLVARFGFSDKNIIAPLALLPIAYYLMKRGSTAFENSSLREDVQAQVDIRRWLIFALLKNAFGGGSDTKLAGIRKKLDEGSSLDAFPLNELNAVLGIEASLSEMEIQELLSYKYQGRYTYLILSLLYPGRDWKDVVLHEDHIFPKSEFHVRKLRQRGYDDEKIGRYRAIYDTVVNLELITDTENLSKSATPFDDWIGTRDEEFRRRHQIPSMDQYGFDEFEEFAEKRRSLLTEKLKAL